MTGTRGQDDGVRDGGLDPSGADAPADAVERPVDPAGGRGPTGAESTDAVAGERIVRAAVVGTGVFVAVAVAAAVSRPTFSTAAVVVSLVLFAVGCAAFLWAYAVAIGRSRVDAIGMGGLFFLHGSAPRRVQLLLIGATAAQVVAAFVTAAVHPFTSQAFVILGPMYGLGLAGLWGARHGTFEPRTDRDER